MKLIMLLSISLFFASCASQKMATPEKGREPQQVSSNADLKKILTQAPVISSECVNSYRDLTEGKNKKSNLTSDERSFAKNADDLIKNILGLNGGYITKSFYKTVYSYGTVIRNCDSRDMGQANCTAAYLMAGITNSSKPYLVAITDEPHSGAEATVTFVCREIK